MVRDNDDLFKLSEEDFEDLGSDFKEVDSTIDVDAFLEEKKDEIQRIRDQKGTVAGAITTSDNFDITNATLFVDSLGMIVPQSKKTKDGGLEFAELKHIIKNKDGSICKVKLTPYMEVPLNAPKDMDWSVGENHVEAYLAVINIWLEQSSPNHEQANLFRKVYPEIAHLNPCFLTIKDVCDRIGKNHRSWGSKIKLYLETIHRLKATVLTKMVYQNGETKTIIIKTNYLLHFMPLEYRSEAGVRGLYYACIDQTYADRLQKSSLANVHANAYLESNGPSRVVMKYLATMREIAGTHYTLKQEEITSNMAIGGTLMNQRKYVKKALDGLEKSGFIRYKDRKIGGSWEYSIFHNDRSANDKRPVTFYEMAIVVYNEEVVNNFGITEEKIDFFKEHFGYNKLPLEKRIVRDMRMREIDRMDFALDLYLFQQNQPIAERPKNITKYIHAIYNSVDKIENLKIPIGYTESLEERYHRIVERSLKELAQQKARKKFEEEEAIRREIDRVSREQWERLLAGQYEGNVNNIRKYFYDIWFTKEFNDRKRTAIGLALGRYLLSTPNRRELIEEEIREITHNIEEEKKYLWEKLNTGLEELCRQSYHNAMPIKDILKEVKGKSMDESFVFTDEDAHFEIPTDFADKFYISKPIKRNEADPTIEVLPKLDDEIDETDILMLQAKKIRGKDSQIQFSL